MTDDITDEELLEEIENLNLSSGTGSGDGFGAPEAKKKDSTLKFFRELIHSKESTKFGNLKENELGIIPITPRDLFDIAQYASAEGLGDLADALNDKAEMIFASSLSKDGFLAQLFVTQIKKESKLKGGTVLKKGLFGSKEVEKNE